VRLLVRAVDLARLVAAVDRVAVVHLEERPHVPRGIGERDLLPVGERVGKLALGGQHHRYRPGDSPRQVHVVDDRLALGLGHEAAQRGEAADREKLEIGELARVEHQLLQTLREVEERLPLGLRYAEVDELSASVGRDRHG
jgi:hypothetical protein